MSRRVVVVSGASLGVGRANARAFSEMPGLLHHHLGRTGYRSQTPEPADPDRPDNLWEPVSGDLGAHGGFGARSHPRSLQAWASAHRRGVLAAGTAAVASALALARRDGR